MHKMLVLGTLCAVLTAPLAARTLGTTETRRVQDAAAVLGEMRQAPDRDVPGDLWSQARCVIVIPGLKRAAFIFGGEYGKGLASCRTAAGWTAPVFVKIAKGSWGAQIGGASIDLILLVMNDRGMARLLENKVSLGTQATIAAGPVGRNAEASTDGKLTAEMLAYSRSRGVFAGISLAGGTLEADADDTRDLYGKTVSAREILAIDAALPTPPEAAPFTEALRLHDEASAAGK